MELKIILSSVVAEMSRGAAMFTCFSVFLIVALVIIVASGLHRVPIGARGVVISMGRRTGQVRDEGMTWLLPFLSHLENIYVRERQIDIPEAEYYTGDRARIAFKTTLRVTVSDPAALFAQGPGTYTPFTRDAVSGVTAGAEEEHVALRRLVQNSIRESVQSLTIQDVMFGGQVHGTLQDRIRERLGHTTGRWGLGVVDVWLVDVEAESQDLRRAVQSEVQEAMDGRGQVAAQQAEISKGALFSKIAYEVADDVRARLGKEISTEEVMHFLVGFYQNERALDVALKSAGGSNDLMQMFYLQHLGIPVPQPRVLAALPMQSPMNALPQTGYHQAVSSDGSWIVGREGDIFLEWDGVSRHHARIDVSGGQMSVTDLGSTNGSYVNGRQLVPNVASPVNPGDSILFGKNVSVTYEQLIAATQSRQIRPAQDG